MAASPVPHLRYPFRVTNGRVATVQQDTFDEVAQCVQMVLTTPLGARIEVPNFGVDDPVFTVLQDELAHKMLNAVNQWEPRAQAALDITVDNIDEYVHHIQVVIPNRPDDIISDSLPQPTDSDIEADGFGTGGWGIQPWGY